MIIVIAPVSGAAFVSQLAAIKKLAEFDFVPNIILASSGGNVAIYLSVMANWKWNKIEYLAEKINSGILFSKWSSFTPISSILGYFKGDAYNKGTGVTKLLEDNIDVEIMKKYEIWTGTYNKTKDKCQLFCNLNKKECKLDEKYIDHDLYQMAKCEYLDHHVESTSKILTASATIPSMCPSQEYNDDLYIDGGMSSSSPFPMMSNSINKYVENNDCSLHIFQLSSSDLEYSKCAVQCNNIFDSLMEASNIFVKSQIIIDRSIAVNLIKQKGELLKIECSTDKKKLAKVLKLNTLVKYSIIEIYPETKVFVNMTSFNGKDVVNKMNEAYDILKCRIWYVNVLEKTNEIAQLVKYITK